MLQAVIHYGHRIEYQNRRLALLDSGVEIECYDRFGKHISHFSSDRGKYHEDSMDIEGESHVIIVSDTGITMITERLRWDQKTEKIITKDPVIVKIAREIYCTVWDLNLMQICDIG